MGSTENLRTPWHVLIGITLERVYASPDKVYTEVQLTREPSRIDVLLIRGQPPPSDDRPLLPSLSRRRGEHTLLEFKGPTDRLEAADFLKLYADAFLYVRLKEPLLRPDQLRLVILSDQLTGAFRECAESYGGRFVEEEEGVVRVDNLHHVLYCLETGVLGLKEDEYLLYPFSRQFLQEPGRVVSRLTGRELALFRSIWQQVLLTRRSLTMEALKDVEPFTRAEEEAWEEFLQLLSPELRLRGLKPEDRLRGLKPEDRLRGLKPEDRLRGLSPEERRRLKEILESEDP